MAQLPCIGLSWPLTKPPFGSCAIYFHHGVTPMSRVFSPHLPIYFRPIITGFWVHLVGLPQFLGVVQLRGFSLAAVACKKNSICSEASYSELGFSQNPGKNTHLQNLHGTNKHASLEKENPLSIHTFWGSM